MSALKEKAVKGISWNFAEKIGVQGIKFTVGIILARLLTPDDFGLIGMITVFFAVANVFIQSGFGQAYVQKKEVSNVDANTVFYTNLTISLLLYVVLWFTAPYIASFYDQPELIELTRVMALVIIINAFNIIQESQIKREINFKKKTIVTTIAIIISGSSAIYAAYNGMGYWSLVVMQMGNRFFITTGLWITSKWKPRLEFSIKSFKEMFAFGSWILASGIIQTIFNNIYILAIGKFFPAAQVGFYTKAKDFQRLSVNQVSTAIGVVAFPVFSKMQDNKEQLVSSMRKFLTYSIFIIAPILTTLIVVAEPLVILLLKEKWATMIPYIQLLSIVGILYPLHLTNLQVIGALGKSNLNFNISMIKNSLRIVNIFTMYRFGVIYIILGEVILSFIALAINTYYTKRLLNYGLFKQIKDISNIIMYSVVAGLFTYIASLLVENYWFILIGGTILSFGLYGLLQYVLNKTFFMEIVSLKENFIKK